MPLEIRELNGSEWTEWMSTSIEVPDDYPEPATRLGGRSGDDMSRVTPGAGKVFVQINHFKDGKRCAETLHALFTKASQPELITVGLLEQNSSGDLPCLQHFCILMGGEKSNGRKEPVCKHTDQIHFMGVFATSAKGPIWARSMIRKLMGDEEFCMQIDSHSDVLTGWDDSLVRQWEASGNENAILSHSPPPASREAFNPTNVPLTCNLGWTQENLPSNPEDGAQHRGSSVPVLVHMWSPRFSFQKCHADRAAPYDPFLVGVSAPEGFTRYTRWFTRGYDVYSPAESVVFHKYDGNIQQGWSRPAVPREESVRRIKTLLQIQPGGDASEDVQANLGAYGLGRRRTLDQLIRFSGIDMRRHKTLDNKCREKKWVPYDPSISLAEPLYGNPSDRDPEPEYWRRKKLGISEVITGGGRDVVTKLSVFSKSLKNFLPAKGLPRPSLKHATPRGIRTQDLKDNLPLVEGLVIIWVMGLLCWSIMFVRNRKVQRGSGGGQPRSARKVRKQDRVSEVEESISGKNA